MIADNQYTLNTFTLQNILLIRWEMKYIFLLKNIYITKYSINTPEDTIIIDEFSGFTLQNILLIP